MQTFREVKQPLKKKNLIPITEENLQEIKLVQPIPYTYDELKKMLEEYGLKVDNLFHSKEGLYPFWYVDEFLFAPIPTLEPSILPVHINGKIVEDNKSRLHMLWANEKFNSFFLEIESQFGFDLFLTLMDKIPEEKRYVAFKKLYIHNEYGFQDIDVDTLRALFALNPDTSFRSRLPVEADGYVTIYRGMQEKSASPETAYSWTLDFEVAKRFALRFNSTECSIYQAKILPEDMIDYIGEGNIGDRGEAEILLLPDALVDVKNLGFYNLNREMMSKLDDEGFIDIYKENAFEYLKGKWFHKPDGIHGKRHIKRVLFLSLTMSYLDDLSYEDYSILIYASLYHDIGREHDWEDEEHGMQSVLKRRKLKLPTHGLNEEDVNILEFIMKYHCIRDEVGLKKIETESGIENKERAIDLFLRFKDCDGLDRVRLGDLDIQYIRTETGKKLTLMAYQLLRNLE